MEYVCLVALFFCNTGKMEKLDIIWNIPAVEEK